MELCLSCKYIFLPTVCWVLFEKYLCCPWERSKHWARDFEIAQRQKKNNMSLPFRWRTSIEGKKNLFEKAHWNELRIICTSYFCQVSKFKMPLQNIFLRWVFLRVYHKKRSKCTLFPSSVSIRLAFVAVFKHLAVGLIRLGNYNRFQSNPMQYLVFLT